MNIDKGGDVLKKGDFIIIGVVVVTIVVLLFSFSKPGNRVVIKHNDKVVYDGSININKTVDTGSNTVIIKDGIVYMRDSNCKNQICVNSGKISKKDEKIICLPNKVIVEIE